MFIKICGITNLEDASAAVEAGADALGFNFYRPSPRYIEPSAARAIIDQLPADRLTVGIFVNEETPETVERIANSAGVAALQLHGDESPEYCERLSDRYLIKVFGVDADFDPRSVLSYDVSAVMLDVPDRKSRGGTGQVIDWQLAWQTSELGKKVFLAGGLSPENVLQAIELVNPYAVDACSSLEFAPGRKDHAQMKRFVAAVRSAEGRMQKAEGRKAEP